MFCEKFFLCFENISLYYIFNKIKLNFKKLFQKEVINALKYVIKVP
jgi:hypothetical protein